MKIKKLFGLFTVVLFLINFTFAQEEEKSITVTIPSALKLVAIDGIEEKPATSVKVSPGTHTFSFNYYKNDIINGSKTQSSQTMDSTFDFKPGYNYILKDNVVLNGPTTVKEDYFMRRVTTQGELLVTMKLADVTPFLKKSKSVLKAIQIVELPKKIEFFEKTPDNDREYEIIGNVHFETMYSAGKFKEENEPDVVFIAAQEMQDKDVDAVIYTDIRSNKGRRVFSLEGIAIKYKD